MFTACGSVQVCSSMQHTVLAVRRFSRRKQVPTQSKARWDARKRATEACIVYAGEVWEQAFETEIQDP
jgi:hypothetical protein